MDDETAFGALADATRRRILDLLFERDGRTLGDLVAAVEGPGRFGVMKHLRVLEAANLVTAVRVGREKHHYLNAVPIRRIHDRWLDKFTARSAATLLALQRALETQPMQQLAAPPTHVNVVYIRATPEAIWRALTESEFTLRYYYQSTVESDWKPGSPYRFMTGSELAIEGEVLEADPPRRLVTTFHAVWDDEVRADLPSRVTLEIADSEIPGVCRLTAIHDQLEGKAATTEQVSGGWPLIFSGLKTLLETGHGLGG